MPKGFDIHGLPDSLSATGQPPARRREQGGDYSDLERRIVGQESGGRHFTRGGGVLTSPAGAMGKWQVMPDKPGGRTRTVGGQVYDLHDPTQNEAAGRAYLSEGLKSAGGDEAGAAIYYFGGPGALNRYRKTGRIPSGGDGLSTFSQYVARATGGRVAPPSKPPQPNFDLDSLPDTLADSPPTASPAPPTQPSVSTLPTGGASTIVAPRPPFSEGAETRPRVVEGMPRPLARRVERPAVRRPRQMPLAERALRDLQAVTDAAVKGAPVEDFQFNRQGAERFRLKPPAAPPMRPANVAPTDRRFKFNRTVEERRGVTPEQEKALRDLGLSRRDVETVKRGGTLPAPRLPVSGDDSARAEAEELARTINSISATPEIESLITGIAEAGGGAAALMAPVTDIGGLAPNPVGRFMRRRAQVGRELTNVAPDRSAESVMAPIGRALPQAAVALPEIGLTTAATGGNLPAGMALSETLKGMGYGDDPRQIAVNAAQAALQAPLLSATRNVPLGRAVGLQAGLGGATTLAAGGTPQEAAINALTQGALETHGRVDPRTIGDYGRKLVPENEGARPVAERRLSEMPDVPVSTIAQPRVVTKVRHSDPRIDGGEVIATRKDGRLEVRNNEGGVSVVKHPRRGGNREAALVREAVDATNETGTPDGRDVQPTAPDSGAPPTIPHTVRAGTADDAGRGGVDEARGRVDAVATRARDAAPAVVDRESVEAVAPPRPPADLRGLDAPPAPGERDTGLGVKDVAPAKPSAGRHIADDDLAGMLDAHGKARDEAADFILRSPLKADIVRAIGPVVEVPRRKVFGEEWQLKTADGGYVTFGVGYRLDGERPGRQFFGPSSSKTSQGIIVERVAKEDVERRAAEQQAALNAKLGVTPRRARQTIPATPTDESPATPAKVVAPAQLDIPAKNVQLEGPQSRTSAAEMSKSVPDREAFKTQLAKAFKLSPDQSEGVAQLVDARAKAWARENGRDASEYIPARFAGVVEGGKVGSGALYQSGDAPTFYSQARRTVESVRQERMTAEQLRAALNKGGVKADEMRWAGLDDLIAERQAKGQPVTKSEVLEHLAANEVKVEEVVKGENATEARRRSVIEQRDAEAKRLEDAVRAVASPLGSDVAEKVAYAARVSRNMDSWEAARDDIATTLSRDTRLTRAEAGALVDTPEIRAAFEKGLALERESASLIRPRATEDTKFSQYTLPGAKEGSYRELLLTLPVKKEGNYVVPGAHAYGDAASDVNRLVHVRFNERTDAEGKRVLFVEEVQSDWHQAGRKEGFKDEVVPNTEGWTARQETSQYGETMWHVRDQNGDHFYWLPLEGAATSAQAVEAAAKHKTAVANSARQIPAAPFSKTWHELAMKRVLRHAAENGYDRVAWTTGEQQAERYDLSKQLDSIKAGRDESGYWFKANRKGYGDSDHYIEKDGLTEAQLEENIGKDAANNVLRLLEENDNLPSGRVKKSYVTLRDENLKVGGEGMKGFYDRILPSFLSKYGKKWGARVGTTEIPAESYEQSRHGRSWVVEDMEGNPFAVVGSEERAQEIARRSDEEVRVRPERVEQKVERAHSIDITDSMRRSVMQEGQPLFQGEKAATEFLKDSRAIIRGFAKADVSSAAHEFAHVFRRDLPPDLLSQAEKDLGVKGGKWERSHEESFARGFERYLKTGEAPSVNLRKVFESFKAWLTDIYGAIRGKDHPLKVKVSPELTAVFDKALGGQPKGEHGQLIHQLHKPPTEGMPAFLEHPAVKSALRLPADASMADVRDALSTAVGVQRSSHVSPERLREWATRNDLPPEVLSMVEDATAGLQRPQAAPPIKAPTAYQQTGVRKVKLDTQTATLSQAVRALGGVRADRSGANVGEIARLSNKETGTSGIVRRDGMNVEEMAQRMRDHGYDASIDPNEFLEQIEADLRGDKIYSNEREIDYEAEYRKARPEEEQDALISLLESERGGILFDKVESGQASNKEVEEFSRVARDEFGLYPDQISAIVREGRRKKKEGVQDSLRGGDEIDFDFRDDPLDAAPSILFQRDNPRQLNLQTSDLELLTQAGYPPPRDATRDQIKSAADSLRQDRLREKLGDNYTRLAGLTESDVDPQVRRLALEMYRRVEAGAEVPETLPDTLTAMRKLAELRRTKTPVNDFLNQGSLFGDRELTPQQERILQSLESSPRKVMDEALPERKLPTQDVLFQSAATGSRRQRAYRALYNAKQPALTPELEPPKLPRTTREKVADVLSIPRSLKSSIDLSAAMRQGAMFTLTHPGRASRIFFGKQLRSLSNKGYEDFTNELRRDPDVQLMKDSGLHLTSLAEDTINNREEAFASRLVGKLPIVGGRIGLVTRSEQAYTTFLDAARSSWFKQLARQAESAAKSSGKPVTPEQYKVIAKFVNRATGRGDLGRGIVNDAAPLLNSIFFAPRYVASRVQVFDPRMYAQLPPGARRTALRQAVQYFATVGAVAALLKYGFDEEVGTDPESSDFGKLKIGNTRYDLTAGQGQFFVLAARLLRHADNARTGKQEEFGGNAWKTLDRYTRYKYAPPLAFGRNVVEGKDAIGRPTTAKQQAWELVAPIYLNDLYDAYRQEGWTGVGKNAPGFVGVGVQTYSAREQKGRPTRPARPRRPERPTR